MAGLPSRKRRLFDGCPTPGGLQPSQFAVQPINFWFKDGHSSNPPGLHSGKETPLTPDRSDVTEFYPLTDSKGIDAVDHPDSSIEKADGEKEGGSPLDKLHGAGTVIAVLDTGIMNNHQSFSSLYEGVDFADKVVECKDFVAAHGEDNCEDFNGHGTQCAGIACGLGFRGWSDEYTENRHVGDYAFNSPAPGARLMVCKVAHDEWDKEEESIRAIVNALDYIITYNQKTDNERERVDVISLSFGFDYFNNELASKVQEAVSGGIIVVCCASNDGSKIPNPISFPARLGNVLCIGACDRYGSPTQFSARGREVDFLELGVDVWAPTIGRRDDTITAVSGTSFSTPCVAGLICRLLQDLRRLSTARPDNCPWLCERMHNVWCMRELLKGMSVTRGHHEEGRGYGKLVPEEYFKKGDEERVRMCKEILGVK